MADTEVTTSEGVEMVEGPLDPATSDLVPLAPVPDDPKAYLLERGWTLEADGRYYDAKPPAPRQVQIGAKKMPNGDVKKIFQTLGSEAPWPHPLAEAVLMERRRNR